MNIFIVITGFETANAVKDCYKTIEFVIGASVECHNYSIKDDNMCELGIPQQGFSDQTCNNCYWKNTNKDRFKTFSCNHCH